MNHGTDRDRALRRVAAIVACIGVIALDGCVRPDVPGLEPTAAAPAASLAMAAPPPQPVQAPRAAAQPSPVPSRDAVSDAVISARVQAGLLSDPAMKGADVSVNTDHGVVNLTGTVKSHEQEAIAAAHAQRPDGVMRIESHLAVDAG